MKTPRAALAAPTITLFAAVLAAASLTPGVAAAGPLRAGVRSLRADALARQDVRARMSLVADMGESGARFDVGILGRVSPVAHDGGYVALGLRSAGFGIAGGERIHSDSADRHFGVISAPLEAFVAFVRRQYMYGFGVHGGSSESFIDGPDDTRTTHGIRHLRLLVRGRMGSRDGFHVQGALATDGAGSMTRLRIRFPTGQRTRLDLNVQHDSFPMRGALADHRSQPYAAAFASSTRVGANVRWAPAGSFRAGAHADDIDRWLVVGLGVRAFTGHSRQLDLAAAAPDPNDWMSYRDYRDFGVRPTLSIGVVQQF